MCQRLIAMLAALAAIAGSAIPAAGAPVVKTEHVEAQLVNENQSAQPGKPTAVGLKLRMADHWHTYWKNPGDSGLPTRIQWLLPEGWKAADIQWPYPKPLPIGPLVNYGYEDEVVLLSDLTPPASAKPGNYPVRAKAEWLVCKDVCIPEKGDLDITLRVAAGASAPEPRWSAHIDRARNMLPVTAPGWKFDSAVRAGTLVVRMTPPAGTVVPADLAFFPERELLIEPAAPQKLVREGNAVRIEMKLADPPPVGITEVAGVAVADAGWPGLARKAIAVKAPISSSMPVAAGKTGASSGGAGADPIGGNVLVALAFAFLGGILLNLMPCVFPVLGIKVMGFVEHAHGDPRAMRMQGWIFAVGVVASFLALASVMLALRAGGTQLGWGFQLQSPPVVAALAALFFVLALNLSGVFEWGAFAQSLTSNLTAKGRYADAFLAGVLASIVATPCTAPFMGAAVGFTLTQSRGLALAVFVMLGIGMAAPVLALAYFPRLLKRLPRPGPWMETFKQVLAFPLYATVAWLTWVLGAQSGNDAVLALLAGLILVAMGAWMYGRWEHDARLWRASVAAIFAFAGVVVAWPSSGPAPVGTAVAARAGELQWEEWSPEKVAALTASGRAVFVDFTAAWCVTCQVNKRVSLHNAAVVSEFGLRGVVALRADWTRQDPRITAALSALGRNAVPVYALYVPGESEPRLLPEVLTPSLVLAELSRLPSAQKGATSLTQRDSKEIR
ncbi:MAG TPA: protein-disulfide reductase DsbD domain-containing protein [Usitatibacter sp.]|nr:protein-disulfide reductase DsbD domain-containing protein [Usitatibacter sp.]